MDQNGQAATRRRAVFEFNSKLKRGGDRAVLVTTVKSVKAARCAISTVFVRISSHFSSLNPDLPDQRRRTCSFIGGPRRTHHSSPDFLHVGPVTHHLEVLVASQSTKSILKMRFFKARRLASNDPACATSTEHSLPREGLPKNGLSLTGCTAYS